MSARVDRVSNEAWMVDPGSYARTDVSVGSITYPHFWALGKEDRSPRPVKSAHRRTRMGGPGGGWSRCGWGSDTRSRRGPALEPVVWTARLGGISHSDRKGGEALPQADGSRPLSKTTHCRLSNNSRAASK
jgi:hypothetical protein